MPDLELDPEKTALLVMDVQNDQFGMLENAGQAGGFLDNVRQVLDGARAAGILVVYVVARFRPGHPEASPRNRFNTYNRAQGRLVEGSHGAEIRPEVAPLSDEIIVTKRRINAFFGTDLDGVLRANGIESIVLTGIATRGVILSSTRHAGDADYDTVILRDCVGDPDPELHDVLMDKVLPMQAAISNASEFLKAIS
jgi:nicotinamidase-related amidase